MDFLTHLPIFLQLTLAMLLGMALGAERTIAHKTAGLRTYGLVALGACLFVIVGRDVGGDLPVNVSEVLHIVGSIITGIGFLGAGVIIFREQTTVGLTTAAGLWIAAGIGVAVGFELYAVAVFTTLLTLLAFTIFWYVEKQVTNIVPRDNNPQ